MNMCVLVPSVFGGNASRLGGALTIVLLVGGAPAAAQMVGDPGSALKAGQQVVVTDEDGRELRGRIAKLAADSLTLARAREREDVAYARIIRIDSVDDLKNGALIGLGVGLGLFAFDAILSSEDGLTLTAAGYVFFGTLYGATGAAAGAGIDALIGGNRNVYERGRSARIRVAPAIGQDSVRAALTISW